MTSYKFVGEDISNLGGVVGVGCADDGGISVRAYSWTGGIAEVELTAEQAKVLMGIIEAHLPGGGMTSQDGSYETVGEAYYEIGVRHRREGGIWVLVSEGDVYATVDLTGQQSKELIQVFEAHLANLA